MNTKKVTIFNHVSNIYFNISIAFMILCYLFPIIFAYDLFEFFASAMLLFTLATLWIILAILGTITALLALPEYRDFLGKLGKFLIGIFDPASTEKVMLVIGKIAQYYWIFPVVAGFSVAMFFTFKALAGEIKSSKSKVILISIMSLLYIISVIMSIVLIGRLNGGA